MDNLTLQKLRKVFMEHGDVTIKDIEELEINNKVFIKYLSAYRLSLIIQKVDDIGHDVEFAAQINILTQIIKELHGGLEKMRMDYYKKKELDTTDTSGKGK